MTGIPTLTTADAAFVAAQHYGLSAEAHELPSDRDQNFLLQTADGRRFVLKVANQHAVRALIDAECDAMYALAGFSTGMTVVPSVVPSVGGDEVIEVGVHLVRLITALPGTPLGAARYRSDALREDVGRALAAIDRALVGFEPAACRRVLEWDLSLADQVVTAHLAGVADAPLREIIAGMQSHHRQHVLPHSASFRRSVIHGDANDFNILVDPSRQVVTGIIDFGDMVHSHTVNDVAIAMAYACLGADDPLGAAAAVLRGYHAAFPLEEREVAALFSLLCMRLCTSVCLAASQQAERPDVEYLGISQGPIRATLPVLAAVHPRFAEYVFRAACGWEPVPQSARVVEWLRAQRAFIAPVLGMDLASTPVAPLDFSAGSALIDSDPRQNAPRLLDERVRRVMADAGASIGVGGYDEARLIYHWPNEPRVGEPRTIHIGLDLTAPAETPLFAPLDGIVHGFENADARHDYGPVIVLRHETDGPEPVPFYTLYGHLTRDSLDGLAIGRRVVRGEQFARIGSAPHNGDWWEHVHVQLIVDMLDVPCNVNGAVRASQRRVWHGICPDPNLLLGIPASRLPRHQRPDEIAASRRRHLGANLGVSYGDAPLTIVRGHRQYLYNSDAHRFIDGYNNVAHVGHGHPRVVSAVARQLAVLNTNTRYLQEQLTQYAEALAATMPDPLEVCYFTASGSEANELALRLARAATGQRDLVVMDAAYHGHTTTMIDVSPYKHTGPGGAGAPDWVHVSPIPDVYRNPVTVGAPGPWFAEQVGAVIDRIAASGRGLCGYLAETCPSVGGQIMLPDGFLHDVYARVHAAGGVCIADEVQTGFGRIGTHFWAFQQQGVTPDIVVLGKPIANGYPMGAVVTTRAIADAFNTGMEFFSTFGGSTAACVAAHETLRVTLDEGLQQNAHVMGERLLRGLRGLANGVEVIGDVRGSGLFLGVECVQNRATRAPAAEAARFVVRRMRDRGVLAGTDGPHHNVIKLRGPMCLADDDADQILDTMARAFNEWSA